MSLVAPKRVLRPVGACLWLALLLAALGQVSQRTQLIAGSHATWLEPAPLSRFDTRLINVATLGHRGLYDDLVTIWTLQYLVDPRIRDADPEAVAGVLRLTTRHLPRLESLYMLSCFVLGLDLRRPDLCEAIAKDGMAAFPESWRIPLTGGFMAARRQDLTLAAAFFQAAATQPKAPEFIALVAQHLAAKQGLTEAEMDETRRRLRDGDDQSAQRWRTYLEDAPAANTRGP